MMNLSLLVWLSICGLVTADVPGPDENGKYTLTAAGINASFIPYSAALTNLFINDRNGTSRDIVLGFDTAAQYPQDPIHSNTGAIPGRYANRIANHTYTLDGVQYLTEINSLPNSTIHSGLSGWSDRTWNVTAVSSSSITFSLYDAAYSSTGMPGDVEGNVTYTVSNDGVTGTAGVGGVGVGGVGVGAPTLSIAITARALTQRTPLMLTNHAYWNLDGFGNPADATVLRTHALSFPSARRLIGYDAVAQADGSLPAIPRYDINDFWSAPKLIGANASSPAWNGNCGPAFGGYDNGWVVDRDDDDGRGSACSASSWTDTPLASLSSSFSGIRWDMYSNQEGVVMTSCGFMGGSIPLKSTQLGGGAAADGYVPAFGCVAVEPQDWIDGINHPEWGRLDKQIYGPENGTYVNDIVYVFSVES